MLTLTVSSNHYDTPDEAAAALKRGLRLLRLRLSRDPKLENFQFLAVFEKHKSGYPHLHLLIRGKFMPWKKLRQWWEEITGSTHIHIKFIDTVGKAAYYVSKYIGKDLSAFANCKRWWRSYGYSEGADDDYSKDRPQAHWSRYEIDWGPMLLHLRLAGYEVERQGTRWMRWKWPRLDEPPPGWLWAASAGKRQ